MSDYITSTQMADKVLPKIKTYVDNGLDTKADKATTLAGYGITDAYTKTEIDGKLAGAFHYKGSVATVADLPATGNEVGDVYNVLENGNNYAWDGTDWDSLSGIVDLSNYYTKTEVDDKFTDVYTKTETDALLDGKQNELTAGPGITILEDPYTGTTVITSADTTYTAGDGIDITNNEISVKYATDAEVDAMLTTIFGA